MEYKLHVELGDWGQRTIPDYLVTFKSVVPHLNHDELSRLVDVLAARNPCNGVSGLYWALNKGLGGNVKDWGELIKLVVPYLDSDALSKLVDVLMPRDVCGTPGLYWAVYKGYGAARDWIGLLREILPYFDSNALSKLVELLAEPHDSGQSILFAARIHFTPYIEQPLVALLQQIVQGLCCNYNPLVASNLAEVLAEINICAKSALPWAIVNNLTDTMPASGKFLPVGKFLQQIVERLQSSTFDPLFELLAAKDSFRAPALFRALMRGDTTTVHAWGKLIQQIVPFLPINELSKLVKLLVAEYRVESGLYFAVKEGHTDTLKAYGELLHNVFQKLPREERFHLFDVYGELLSLNEYSPAGLKEDIAQVISTWQEQAYRNLNRTEQPILCMAEPDAEALKDPAALLVEKKYEEAYESYKSLMDKGSAEATFQLGLMTLNGQRTALVELVESVESEAIQLLQLAHDLKHNKAAQTIGDFYLDKGKEYFPLANQWYEKALKLDNFSVQLTVYARWGQMHLTLFQQNQQPASLAQAREWYQKVVDSSEKNEKSPDRAEALFQLAKTTIDHPPGFFGLSTEEKSQLVTQLEEAHETGHKEAAYELARWYENRFSWPHERASYDQWIRHWYNEASKVGHDKAKEWLNEHKPVVGVQKPVGFDGHDAL